MRKEWLSRQSLLEITLLAAVVAGIFFAKLIVDSQSRILLAPGITLPGSGLTVHLPQQNNWRALKEWQYERDNSFVLPARLVERSGPLMDVYWKYDLNTTAADSRHALEETVSRAGGRLADTARTTADCPMEYGKVIMPQNRAELYVGAARLDFGRVLILQVQSGLENASSAKAIFLVLANSIQYEKPAEMTRGEELLQKLRQFETPVLFADIPRQNLLVRDTSGGPRGYETAQFTVDTRGRVQINKTTAFRVTPAGMRRKENLFESLHPFETFNWRCQSDGVSSPPGVFCLRLKDDGALAMEDAAGRTQTCRPGPVIVSQMLLDVLVRFFLETEQQKTVLDILYDDGRIIPAQISSIPLAQAKAKAEEMAFAVHVESLDGTTTEFYFDADKKSLGKLTLELNRGTLLWEPADQKEVEKYFNTPPARKGPVAEIKTQNSVLSHEGNIPL
jgi:hypothetical protein